MKTALAIILMAASTAVWATCVSTTIYVNGKPVTCVTCCEGKNCTTSCF
jgi:hypothetical protein